MRINAKLEFFLYTHSKRILVYDDQITHFCYCIKTKTLEFQYSDFISYYL